MHIIMSQHHLKVSAVLNMNTPGVSNYQGLTSAGFQVISLATSLGNSEKIQDTED